MRKVKVFISENIERVLFICFIVLYVGGCAMTIASDYKKTSESKKLRERVYEPAPYDYDVIDMDGYEVNQDDIEYIKDEVYEISTRTEEMLYRMESIESNLTLLLPANKRRLYKRLSAFESIFDSLLSFHFEDTLSISEANDKYYQMVFDLSLEYQLSKLNEYE